MWNTDQSAWIGILRKNGDLRWDGKSTGKVEIALWSDGQPTVDEPCVMSFAGDFYRLHDTLCTRSYHYICERLPNTV